MVYKESSIGISIQANNSLSFISSILQAEAAGIRVAWTTIGGVGGADPLTVSAAALTATKNIEIGTAIIPTWPRHPIIIAQQALALEQLAPGRLRLGIGPSHEPMMAGNYGVNWEKPLTNLKEYLQIIRMLLETGEVNFQGQTVSAIAKIKDPYPVTLMASALRQRSFEACGELTDGAISWMCPKQFLIDHALPALQIGAERANRPIPPLVAHVPMLVTDDRKKVYTLAKQLQRYTTIPFYRAMFEKAGYTDIDEQYPKTLIDDLVVSGSESEVAEHLVNYINAGCGEVIAAPIIDPDSPAESFEKAVAAIALADSKLKSKK